MEFWLRKRCLQIVKGEDIQIVDFKMPDDVLPMEQSVVREVAFHAKSAIDANIPHALGRVCRDTVTLRVVAQDHKQYFLLVRDNLSATFPKKDLVDICDHFLTFAPCIIVASSISASSIQAIRETSQKSGHGAELLSIQDLEFDKLRNVRIPYYKLLTRAEIAEVETNTKSKACDFPRMLASDPIAKYCKLIPGNVLETRDKKTGKLSYRIVTSNSGVVPQAAQPQTEPKEQQTQQQSV